MIPLYSSLCVDSSVRYCTIATCKDTLALQRNRSRANDLCYLWLRKVTGFQAGDYRTCADWKQNVISVPKCLQVQTVLRVGPPPTPSWAKIVPNAHWKAMPGGAQRYILKTLFSKKERGGKTATKDQQQRAANVVSSRWYWLQPLSEYDFPDYIYYVRVSTRIKRLGRRLHGV